MDITSKDLQFLVDQENKKVYRTIYGLVVKEYENLLIGTRPLSDDDPKFKAMGSCGIYLSSLVELLHTTRDLIDKGFIESGGSVATSLWERALTLRKIMLDPIKNSQILVEHEKVKSTPWIIWNMVKEVTDREVKDKSKREITAKLFYMQYTFLCSIKHGNPYTVSYLNRPDRSSERVLYKVKPNDSVDDIDLKIHILLLSMDIALDAIIDYSRIYRNQTEINGLAELRDFLTRVSKSIPLEVPKIFISSPEEMGKDFWEFLERLDAEERPRFEGPLI